MTQNPRTKAPILQERTFRHVSWRQGARSGVWQEACFTQECLAVDAECTLDPLKPVQLRLILQSGEMVLTQGVLTSSLEEGESSLMLFTLALTQEDVAVIQASPPDEEAPPSPQAPEQDSTHLVALSLMGATLLGLTLALFLG